MRNCIATYSTWTTGNDESWRIFDHPCPTTEPGTVGRMLRNFMEMGVRCPVVLYPAPFSPEIERHMVEVTAGFDLDLHIFTSHEMRRIRALLRDHGFPAELETALDLANYGRYRNWMLLYAALKGYDNVVQIDDDELIETPDFLARCERDLGDDFEGRPIWGKSGCYIGPDGSKYYDGQIRGFKDWPKDEMFNEAVKRMLAGPGGRLLPCTVAFGGNMVINRRLFLNVPYDINIPRGEDDDYVANAQYRGFTFVFDRDLTVRHLPPGRAGLFWTRMRQDIRRFQYLREKARLLGRQPNECNVFYDYFLQDDLERKAVIGSLDAARTYMDSHRAEALEFLANAELAVSIRPEELRAQVERQVRFMDAWAAVLPKIVGLWA